MSWLFDIDKVRAAFAGVGDKWLRRLVVQAGQEETGELGEKVGLDLGFAADNPHVGEFVDEWNGRFSQSLTSHTYDDLRTTLMQGMDAGENLYDMRKRVQESMEYARADYAERTARTETARAMEGGRLEAWRQSGVVIGREWLAAGDSCEFCAALAQDGIIRNFDSPYIAEGASFTGASGGSMVANYGPVMYPPAHPNCTCTTVEVFADDLPLEGPPLAEEAAEAGVVVEPQTPMPVAANDLRTALESTKRMPRRAHDALAQSGSRVELVADGGITAHPKLARLRGITPRGWEGTGLTWDDVGGAGPTNPGNPIIIVANKINTSASVNVVLHEAGHGVDRAFQLPEISSEQTRLSARPEWLRIHEEQRAAGLVPSAYQRAYAEEYWAESFASMYDSPSARAKLPAAVRAYFTKWF